MRATHVAPVFLAGNPVLQFQCQQVLAECCDAQVGADKQGVDIDRVVSQRVQYALAVGTDRPILALGFERLAWPGRACRLCE